MQKIKTCKPIAESYNVLLSNTVNEIINSVRSNGDDALISYNEKFEGSSRKSLRITTAEIQEAYSMVSDKDIESITFAAKNIKEFAEAQKKSFKPLDNIETMEGAILGHRIIPINSVACYVPGGNYPLFSSALMLIIPAKVAGSKRVVAVSPTMKNSNVIHPQTLVAMDIAGADEIYAVGGAHSIAALAYGTKQITPVDIIVGPGNQYVAEAKRQCYGQVGIDFVAGPSEVLIIADDTAPPKIIAADLLAQSEHDVLAKGILISTSMDIINETLEEIELQLKTLSTKKIATKAWQDNGEIIFVNSLEEAVNISNFYAPEHLEVIVHSPDSIIDKLTNYGSLFIGKDTGEVFGDYASGTNHTLPTMKASRYTGGVWVGTFLKVCTYQKMNEKASNSIAPIVAKMAEGEGLDGHKNAALARIK